jgi:uncharacterized protein
MDLDRTTALVTGSSRGIGRAIAAELAKRPLASLLCGVRSEAAGPPVDGPPGGAREVRAVHLDLSTRESIERAAATLPPVDLLVNNAGLMTGGLLEQQDTDDVYAMFQVNLVGLVHLTKLVLPGMIARGRGTIVNNASISGYAWFPAATTYAAAKTGVVAFSESLRRELEGTGVNVLHLVTPGVDTDMLDATREVYGRHMDSGAWSDTSPEEWAAKVVRAVERGDHVLGPGGRLALAKLASRGPAALLDAVSKRMFSREPR